MNQLVWTYDARLPLGPGPEIVDRDIRESHRYYNQLIEIERWYLERKESIRRQYLPGLDATQSEIDRLNDEMERIRAGIRARNASAKRLTASEVERQQLRHLRQCRSEACARRRDILSRVQDNPEYLAALEQLHAELLQRRRGAYAAAECCWGSKLKIAQSVESAMTIMHPVTGKRMPRTVDNPPRFRRWTGDGVVAVQLQHGLSASAARLGQDSRLRIVYPPDTRSQKRARLVIFWLRVGSIGRKPVWLKVPAYEQRNRPLPSDAQITWACLVRRRGPQRRYRDPNNPAGVWRAHDEYQIQLTIRTEQSRPMAVSGLCGVDLGWKLLEDGRLRVAYWQGDDGHAGQLTIDPSGWRKEADLQSIRRGNFNDVRGELIKWLEAHPDRPSWLTKATENVHQWRSFARLCRLVDDWQQCPGDELILTILRRWRVRENHLENYQHGLRQSLQRERLHIYRTFAARLARRYRRISVEDCNWRRLNALPADEANKAVNATARFHMRIAAVGMLRQAIVQSGAEVYLSKTKDSTRECQFCGHVNEWTDRERMSLMVTCQRCLQTWDQDQNAAAVLLARARVTASTTGNCRSQVSAGGEDASVLVTSGTREANQGNMNGDAATVALKPGRWQRRRANRSQEGAQTPAPSCDGTTAGAVPVRGG